MNEKKAYEEAKIEIIKFDSKDIVTTSDGVYKNDQDSNQGGSIKLKFFDL